MQNDTLNNWPFPTPLNASLAPETPYPVDALPSLIHQAVSVYQQYGQQPLPLVASSALANISLACQSLANVARDRYLTSPISLFFLSVAASGVLFFATFLLRNCLKLLYLQLGLYHWAINGLCGRTTKENKWFQELNYA